MKLCAFLLTVSLLATRILFIYMLSIYLFHVWLFLIRTICHWNLNNILAYNFVKLSLLRPIITIYNNILNLNDPRFSEVLLFGNSSFNSTKKTYILNTTIENIVSSKRSYVDFCYSF